MGQPCMLFEQLLLERMPDSSHLLANDDFTDPHKVAEQTDALWLAMSLNGGAIVHKVCNHVQEFFGHSLQVCLKSLTPLVPFGATIIASLVTEHGSV